MRPAALLDLLSVQAFKHECFAAGHPVYLCTALHLHCRPCCASAVHCATLMSVTVTKPADDDTTSIEQATGAPRSTDKLQALPPSNESVCPQMRKVQRSRGGRMRRLNTAGHSQTPPSYSCCDAICCATVRPMGLPECGPTCCKLDSGLQTPARDPSGCWSAA